MRKEGRDLLTAISGKKEISSDRGWARYRIDDRGTGWGKVEVSQKAYLGRGEWKVVRNEDNSQTG